MQHRLVFFAAAATAALGLLAGCGDDKVPAKQAVFWLGLNPGAAAQCSSNENYRIPADAQMTISSIDANGERIKDSADFLVECDVRLARGSTTDYTVDLRLSGGDVGNFSVNGTLNDQGGQLDISFNTGVSLLEQDNCEATVETLTPGAVWLRTLSCPNLRDGRSPNAQCNGQGGLIFENCDR